MNTIKEIQELATQTGDWTRRRVAGKLLESIDGWKACRKGLDKCYLDSHGAYTVLVNSYPKYPDDIPQSVADADSILWNVVEPKADKLNDYSNRAKEHAERIDEYFTFLGIFGDDEKRLWEEIAQKEDN
jgi:hypothetical protein